MILLGFILLGFLSTWIAGHILYLRRQIRLRNDLIRALMNAHIDMQIEREAIQRESRDPGDDLYRQLRYIMDGEEE